MFSKTTSLLLLALNFSSSIAASIGLESRQAYSLVGDGFNESTQVLGNYYNYWRKLPNGTFDLTRSDITPVTSPKVIPMLGSRKEIIIEPNRTGLVIIDMQNFFLHPQLNAGATLGRAAVQPTVNMINGFRKHGMKILWTNWGLTEYDLLTIPPSFKSGFTMNGSDIADQSFGADMGTIVDNGTTIEVGELLMRGSWNGK